MEFELGQTYSGYKFLDVVRRSRAAVQYRVQNTLAQRVESLRTLSGAASDDPDAAQPTRELAAKIPGVRALDGGRLENARIVEQITALLIGMNIRYKGHAGIRITGLPPSAYR